MAALANRTELIMNLLSQNIEPKGTHIKGIESDYFDDYRDLLPIPMDLMALTKRKLFIKPELLPVASTSAFFGNSRDPRAIPMAYVTKGNLYTKPQLLPNASRIIALGAGQKDFKESADRKSSVTFGCAQYL